MSIYHSSDQLRSPMVRRLYQWWMANCRFGLPDRSDFEPTDFADLLPNIMILDVEHDPFRVRYRLVGTRAREATGFNILGRYLDELMPTEPEAPWLDIYWQSYQQRAPVIGESTCTTTAGGLFTYEYGVFPLRKGNPRVDQFVAIEDYGNLTSTLTDLVQWSEREKPVIFDGQSFVERDGRQPISK
ncbi:MAG TPA: PAS domain-containing protein [Dongiaceae bacterium]|nr:PAS domain-containing protein [Dongiaceae bacterium]